MGVENWPRFLAERRMSYCFHDCANARKLTLDEIKPVCPSLGMAGSVDLLRGLFSQSGSGLSNSGQKQLAGRSSDNPFYDTSILCCGLQGL